MGHVPHVYLPAPWPAGSIPLPDGTRHHLERVLRIRPGEELSYTDGAGTVGAGTLEAGGVARARERSVPPPAPSITMAVAPPQRTERARMLVEKLAELGVDRLVWLQTVHGSRRPPSPGKVEAWTVAALEQSQGARRLAVGSAMAAWDDLRANSSSRSLWVAERGHDLLPSVAERAAVTVAIGPEAGFSSEEIPADGSRFGLGDRVLRVETAAIAAAVLVLARTGRLGR